MVSGELCVIMASTTTMHKSPALCSDLGEVYLCSNASLLVCHVLIFAAVFLLKVYYGELPSTI